MKFRNPLTFRFFLISLILCLSSLRMSPLDSQSPLLDPNENSHETPNLQLLALCLFGNLKGP